jgi:hypothetical protein
MVSDCDGHRDSDSGGLGLGDLGWSSAMLFMTTRALVCYQWEAVIKLIARSSGPGYRDDQSPIYQFSDFSEGFGGFEEC